MSNWHILYYKTEKGKCFIEEFIDSKKESNQIKIFSFLKLLQEKGPLLERPYADLLKDGVHELRIKLSGNQTRILYFFCYKNYIILTHAFQKKSDRVPEKEIKKAKKIRDDFLNRFNNENKIKEALNEGFFG